MKLLEILDIQGNDFSSDDELVEKINKSYKKLAFKFHPDRNPDNPSANENFQKLSAVYELLMEAKYRQYYIANYQQLDVHFNDEDKYVDFITNYIKNAVAPDVDKVNSDVAQYIYVELARNFFYNSSGLNNINIAINSINNPLYTYLPPEAKKLCLEFIEGKREEITEVIEKAQGVFAQQNIRYNQQGLRAICDLISQISRNNYSGIPQELFKNVEENKKGNFIAAYYDVLIQNKNLIESLCQRAQQVVFQQNFQCNQQSLVTLSRLITKIAQGNYEGIPPTLLQGIAPNLHAPLITAYLECLNQNKNYIEFVYQKAQAVIDQHNFQCTQQDLKTITDLMSQISQNNYSGVPQRLFENVDESKKGNLIAVYYELLNQNKNYIEFIYQRAQEAINQYHFQFNRQSLAVITQITTELSQGNYRHVPPKLFENVTVDKGNLTFAYRDLLNQYKNQIEPHVRLEEQRKLEEQQSQQKEELRKLEEKKIAEQTINNYLDQIKTFPVDFSGATTIRFVQKQQKVLLEQLDNITRNKEGLVHALNTLNIKGQSLKISEAISTKAKEINSVAQELQNRIEVKHHEEEHKLKQQQVAEGIINNYVEQIKTLAVDFSGATTVELVQKQQKELLGQLDNITRNKEDLIHARNILKNQSPKISEAIFTKKEEINFTAQELQTNIELAQRKLHEEQQRLEEQRKEQQHPRKVFINSTDVKINNILDDLSKKIGGIGQHHFEEAKVTAERLLNELQEAKIDYLTDLNNLDRGIEDVNKDFENKCKVLIDEARPVLERDLDWGTYLTNLLKAIANAIIWVASFGQANRFFKQERAESIKTVEEAEQKLKS